MGKLTLVEVGELPAGPLRSIPSLVSLATGLEVQYSGRRLDPAFAFDRARSQFDSRRVLSRLEEWETDGLVLGVLDQDIYSAIFTFVFGEAHLGGRTGLVSMHRLRPEVYGLPPDPMRLHERLLKEVLHEVGHLLGLVHCHAPACVMGFSGTVEEIDDKADDFCDACLDRIVAERSRPERSAFDRAADQGA